MSSDGESICSRFSVVKCDCAAGVEGISDCVELELLGVVVSIGVGAWIVGHATEVKVTLIGLTPICSISNIVRKGKQLLSKWMEHNAEYSVGQVQAPLFSFTKSLHFFRCVGSLGKVWSDTPSAFVFPQFAATHLIPLPLPFSPLFPRGMLRYTLFIL
jgi:hypothetical protein